MHMFHNVPGYRQSNRSFTEGHGRCLYSQQHPTVSESSGLLRFIQLRSRKEGLSFGSCLRYLFQSSLGSCVLRGKIRGCFHTGAFGTPLFKLPQMRGEDSRKLRGEWEMSRVERPEKLGLKNSARLFCEKPLRHPCVTHMSLGGE